jgi:hypothetical protein
VAKGGILVVTIVLLFSMICAVNGWGIFVTPVSLLGTYPATRTSFTYFITFQTLILGALYNRRNAKPILMFVGLASLVLISIYDMKDYTSSHNLFAAIFFICQPIIFFLEYKAKKDPYELTKGAILLFLIILFAAGIIPIPLFEFISYTCLILFL